MNYLTGRKHRERPNSLEIFVRLFSKRHLFPFREREVLHAQVHGESREYKSVIREMTMFANPLGGYSEHARGAAV